MVILFCHCSAFFVFCKLKSKNLRRLTDMNRSDIRDAINGRAYAVTGVKTLRTESSKPHKCHDDMFHAWKH
eukprot:3877604-Amphidinium_carterae.1